jgi:large subunit ribosomal protein L21
MYAIVETGGKQYRVEEGSKITVEKLSADAGAQVALDKVLLVGQGGDVTVGAPYVKGAKVTCEVVEHPRGPKITVFHKWRRNDSHKKTGHRQDLTVLTVKSVKA